MNISLGIFDYLAVIIFAVSACFLTQTIWKKISIHFKVCSLFGGTLGFVAGILKATHKLILLASGNDLTTMKNIFFILNGCGFFLIATALAAFLCNFIYKKISNKFQIPMLIVVCLILILAPILFIWAPLIISKTMYLVILILSYLFVVFVLWFISIKINHKLLIISYVISLITLIATILASASDNLNEWARESLNTANQASLLVSILLFRYYYLKLKK